MCVRASVRALRIKWCDSTPRVHTSCSNMNPVKYACWTPECVCGSEDGVTVWTVQHELLLQDRTAFEEYRRSYRDVCGQSNSQETNVFCFMLRCIFVPTPPTENPAKYLYLTFPSCVLVRQTSWELKQNLFSCFQIHHICELWTFGGNNACCSVNIFFLSFFSVAVVQTVS